MKKLADRLFGGLVSGLNILASLWVLVLVALISADVIGRSGFNFTTQSVIGLTSWIASVTSFR